MELSLEGSGERRASGSKEEKNENEKMKNKKEREDYRLLRRVWSQNKRK